MKNKATLPENISPRLILLRNQPVLLDRDVAKIYGVETKRINEVVKNNLDKFPSDYMFPLNDSEFANLRSFLTTSSSGHGGTRYAPKAFTEKGLYMLATLLRSKQAIEATFGIIETYAQVRELQTTLITLHNEKKPKEAHQFYIEYPIANALRSQFNWTQYKLPIRLVAESRKEDNA